MADTPYEAFRFLYTRSDAPGGGQQVHYLSVQQSLAAAMIAVRELTGASGLLTLIGQGPNVLREAAERGMANGQTTAL